MNIRETAPRITELEKISTRTDTRDYLAKAASTREKLKDWLIVDVDAHVNETSFWSEVTERIDNDVLRYIAQAFRERSGSPPGLLNANGPLFGVIRQLKADGIALQRAIESVRPRKRRGVAPDGAASPPAASPLTGRVSEERAQGATGRAGRRARGLLPGTGPADPPAGLRRGAS